MGKEKEVMYMLGQISSKLDSQAENFTNVWKKLESHDKTLISLQAYQDQQKGQITVLAIIWGSLSAIAVGIFTHLFNTK